MFELSQDSTNLINKELSRYETKYSAIIPSLFIIQKEKGWVAPEAVKHLSKLSGIPEAHINEVRQFYTMFNQEPVGKLHVQVCTNISCSMNGGRELADHICRQYKTKLGEVSPDGKVTVSRVECLGSCDTAPMMQVNDKYIENLTPEKAIAALKEMGG